MLQHSPLGVDDKRLFVVSIYMMYGKVRMYEGIRNGLHDIQDLMSSWGDGSRAQVCLQWDIGEEEHTFGRGAKKWKDILTMSPPKPQEIPSMRLLFSKKR